MSKIDEIIDDFEVLDDWEDRYRYLIELGQDLTPLDDSDYNDANKVRGCVSAPDQVRLCGMRVNLR